MYFRYVEKLNLADNFYFSTFDERISRIMNLMKDSYIVFRLFHFPIPLLFAIFFSKQHVKEFLAFGVIILCSRTTRPFSLLRLPQLTRQTSRGGVAVLVASSRAGSLVSAIALASCSAVLCDRERACDELAKLSSLRELVTSERAAGSLTFALIVAGLLSPRLLQGSG